MQEGHVAFAVFFNPEELLVEQAGYLELFEHLHKYRYPLVRHAKGFHEEGKCYGIGFRPGYEANKSFGSYRCPPRHGKSGNERAEERENFRLENIGGRFARALESVMYRRLPAEYEEKVALVDENGLPTLADSNVCPHILPTVDYAVNDHLDSDKGAAYGLWLEQHGRHCLRQGKTCCRTWAFVFPEYNIGIPLQHGTCIAWQGNVIRHGTLLQKRQSFCHSHKALSIVTQVKRSLIERVQARNRRNMISEV